MKRNIIERKKEMIRELTQAAWSELAGLHEQEQRGALPRAAAQQAAIARIQSMRYGDDGKDYFWISDTQTRMVMHPYRPELNGRSLLDYSDPAGKKLFVEFTQVVRDKGDGYVDYLWQWKDDEKRVVPKLSYVKGFAPWGWIVGTGIYLEDVRAEISQMIRRVLQISVGISVVIAALLAYISQAGARPRTPALAGGNGAARVGGEVPAAGGRHDGGRPAGAAGPPGVREQDPAQPARATRRRNWSQLPLDQDHRVGPERRAGDAGGGTARQDHRQERRGRRTCCWLPPR